MAGRKRHDPVVRAADGRRSYDRIAGKDPSRHYVLTNPNDEETGTAFYVEQLGYTVEKVRADGPTSSASRAGELGSKVTAGGQVLVSCPMEEFEARESDGQSLSGALEARILKEGGDTRDPLRGRGWEIGIERNRQMASEEA